MENQGFVADECLYRFQEICELSILGKVDIAYKKMLQQSLFIKGHPNEGRLCRVFLNAMNQAHYHIFLNAFDVSFHQLCYQHGILFHEIKNWDDFVRTGQQIIYAYALAAPSIHAKHHGAIYKVIRYIRDNLDTALSLEQIANEVFMSRSYLSHSFKETMGENIKDFIYRERMRLAENLLISSNLGIEEISLRCGYQSLAYFSASFRRFFHMSSTEFRDYVE